MLPPTWWLHVKYSTEIISKLFPCFILHVNTSEIISKLFQPLQLFQNYFSDIEHVGMYYVYYVLCVLEAIVFSLCHVDLYVLLLLLLLL